MEAKPVRVSAHQPNFLPWVGFWHKFLSADVFVICLAPNIREKVMVTELSWRIITAGRPYQRLAVGCSTKT